MTSTFSAQQSRRRVTLAVGAAFILAMTGAVAACSSPGSPSASSLRAASHAAPTALHSGTPRLAASFTVPGGGLVNEAQFSPDGKLVAAASVSAAGASRIYVWDVATRRYLMTLDVPGGSVYLAFSEDDSTLTALVERTGSGSASIERWDLATGARATLWIAPSDANWVVGYDDSTLAVANSADDAVQVLGVGTGRLIADIRMPDSANIVDDGLELDANGGTLVASDQRGNSYVWDVATGALVARLRYPAANVVKGVLQDPLYLSPDGKTLVVPGAQGASTTLVNVATGADVTPNSALWPRDNGGCLFAVDSRVCATARDGHTIDLWDIGTHTHLATVTSPALVGIEGIPAIGPDASEVVTLGPFPKTGTSKLYLWDIP